MYQQHLPHYIHEFESFSGWITKESENYIFHFTEGSEAENDIEIIVDTQEAAFSKIIQTLDLPYPDKKIQYYLYPDPELKKKLMGDDWFAQSIYNEFRIHALYTKTDKPIGPHEDTHLLTLPWGLSSNFLQEGLAEYMVGHCWDGTTHTEKLAEGLRRGLDLSPMKQLTDQDWFNAPDEHMIFYYALAGSWAAFLIHEYGLEQFKALYQNTNRGMTAEEISEQYKRYIGEYIPSLEAKFLATIEAS